MEDCFFIEDGPIPLKKVMDYIFSRRTFKSISVSNNLKGKIEGSFSHLLKILDDQIPVYGVTTGFGGSCHKSIGHDESKNLQENLLSYLRCGTGRFLDYHTSKATLLLRIISLSKGYSGVSPELISHMILFADKGWFPLTPREGSLGASGDLIPLSYLGNILRGEGEIITEKGTFKAAILLKEQNVKPYKFKPKEGLAVVNGTSSMAAYSLINYNYGKFLINLAHICSAWLCLSINGRVEAFGRLVNQKAKLQEGQFESAKMINSLLEEESYSSTPYKNIKVKNHLMDQLVQDPYSLRCSPQILGPILETFDLVENWLEKEVNSVSDNPLIDEEGQMATGGNFYGGHLSHGMDYLKISLGHLADHMDRQLSLLINGKTNRGLPDNLVYKKELRESERHSHHGLKGLHQCVSALTSEIMAMTIPNGIFSRSSESHNQDKVSLGMSAASQCSDLIDKLFSLTSCYLICLTQALDLRGINLKGKTSNKLYNGVRKVVPLIKRDSPLDSHILELKKELLHLAIRSDDFFIKK